MIDKDGQVPSNVDWVSPDRTHVVPASLMLNLQGLACAKWYEFWKRPMPWNK